MFSYSYATCIVVVCDHECWYCLPPFGRLRNTTHWGKIEGTRPSALCFFAYSKHANGRLVFQASLTFSPVRGVLPLPLLWEGKHGQVLQHLQSLQPLATEVPSALEDAIRYLQTQGDWIGNYSQWQAQGYPVGSGLVERAVAVVINARMKKRGMR